MKNIKDLITINESYDDCEQRWAQIKTLKVSDELKKVLSDTVGVKQITPERFFDTIIAIVKEFQK